MECRWDASLLQHGAQLPPELIDIIQSAEAGSYLQGITRAALDARYTYTLFSHCEDIFPHVCATLRTHGNFSSSVALLGRVVPFAPYLWSYVEQLLSKENYTFSAAQSHDDNDLEYLLGLFRLFAFDSRALHKYVHPEKIAPLLHSSRRPVVYLAIRILQIYLDGADHWFEEMVAKYLGPDTAEDDINGPWDDTMIDYRFLSLWEEERFKKVSQLQESVQSQMKDFTRDALRILQAESFDPSTVLISGVLMPRNSPTPISNRDLHQEIVQVPSAINNLTALTSALKTSRPVLLKAPAGAGKTLLVRHVARCLGKLDDMVTLHLNEQSDAKSLIGVYTTGDSPGSFTWKPGVLTTAVQEGRWIMIEDLDRAPHEIIGTLLPLIEKRELYVPSRKQTMHAAHEFQIIASVRTSVNHRGEEIDPLIHMIGLRHWQAVRFSTPDLSEMQTITTQLYTSLTPLVPQFLAIYGRLTSSGEQTALVGRSKTGILRALTPRDFFKWCSRVSSFLQPDLAMTSIDVDEVFLSAVDCFAGALPDGAERLQTAAILAEELRIDPQRRDHLLQDRNVLYVSNKKTIAVGRYNVLRAPLKGQSDRNKPAFSTNPHTSRILERVVAAVTNREPLLLIGETGVGKTAAVQHLATEVGKKLVPFNLSQQSEAGDLLGGFRPVTIRSMIVPVKDRFDELFTASFSMTKNQQFLELMGKHCRRENWTRVCSMWHQALKMVEQQRQSSKSTQGEAPSKKRKTESRTLDYDAWDTFRDDVLNIERRLAAGESAFAFAFVEGNIVKAARNGDWILLDEINLASPDTLESLADLFDTQSPSLLLAEAGNVERVDAHPDFRVFAAMNPATDVGKKDLPPGIRSRFTELYVAGPDKDLNSLQSIVRSYLSHESATDPAVPRDTSVLYQQLMELREENRLVDGAGQAAHFSLRTLTRTLSYAKYVAPCCNLRRALYEGFQMSFVTLLDAQSAELVQPLLEQHLLGKRANMKAELQKALRKPIDGHQYIQGFPGSKHWIRCGDLVVEEQPHYILTPFIKSNLENLVRATSTRQFPVLIQGPTSSGKTSMIEYLARRTGHKFVRINNHEHTDLQEYLGTYASDANGKLHFQEGLLVQALRHGHWIVLDELNLAPTDVLEALNRLLDDNRELLIPETQKYVRPHPEFMLFATQNPAGLYGGRKVLSRAFRNRFLELHFDDIPVDELQEILHRRTQLPESRCKRIVAVYRELAVLRQEERLFEQKSFATLRDLFRWALRPNHTIDQLAANGFMLLAERVRKPEERQILKEVIERVTSMNGPRVTVDETILYSRSCDEISNHETTSKDTNIVWTKAMRRLYVLVSRAIENNEPVLLVGDTGCGKTTVCQMLARALKKELHTVNAHQSTETGDLIGSQRPARNRSATESTLRERLLSTPSLHGFAASQEESTEALVDAYDRAIEMLESSSKSAYTQSTAHLELQATRMRFKALFEWVDGPLVHAMKSGNFFLLDEISLADDSVLERMNSVLESSRSILLAEKGSLDSQIVATPGFQLFATMNPGGDYGKKELSPALRNRFTEIWVPPLHDAEDVQEILSAKLDVTARPYSKTMVTFAQWFNARYNTSASSSISIRDLLAWAGSVNTFAPGHIEAALVHGAAMVYIDTLGANPAGMMALSQRDIDQERAECLTFLSTALSLDAAAIYSQPATIQLSDQELIAGPFRMPRQAGSQSTNSNFSFQPTTTRLNALRVIRAMQLTKPILLEGSPGVGKTALVGAIAQAVGMPLTRINLSEQTDLIDLFGSDVPTADEQIGSFTWQDAPFLRAMKRGEWVLLDEMNLASQSVLEGLNSCLDHRGEVFVPELGQTFQRHPDFRLFAAQNPHHQGGGRKGLPASFVNRFTVVFADAFRPDDLILICQQMFPKLEISTIRSAVQFLETLEVEVSHRKRIGAQGAPWEFNLRDLSRWLALASSQQDLIQTGSSRDFIDMLFSQRFRSHLDRAQVNEIQSHIFNHANASDLYLSLSTQIFQIGLATLPRKLDVAETERPAFNSLPSYIDPRILQSLAICIQQKWPVILTGASGAGKTNIVRHLASITGARVTTISMNAETDAMDLIGGYDQADYRRAGKIAADRLQGFISTVSRTKLTEKVVPQALEALAALRSIDSGKVRHESLHELRSTLEHCGLSDTQSILADIPGREAHIEKARFEWIDGLLIEALQTGKWLILDNANLCSPSVLDRLNSLLESNGMLIINEHSSPDGEPRIIRPHPEFRIFMTVDPLYGELSRAMRNRAVEIYLALPTTDAVGGSGAGHTESTIARLRDTGVLPAISQQGHDADVITDILSDHLSPHDAPLVPRFVRQLHAGLYNITPADPDEMLSKQLSLPDTYGPDLEKFYSLALGQLQAPADLAVVQTLHPYNNQALVKSSPQALDSAHVLALVKDATADRARLEKSLADVESDSVIMSELQQIERSLNLNLPAPSQQSQKRSAVVVEIMWSFCQRLQSWSSTGPSALLRDPGDQAGSTGAATLYEIADPANSVEIRHTLVQLYTAFVYLLDLVRNRRCDATRLFALLAGIRARCQAILEPAEPSLPLLTGMIDWAHGIEDLMSIPKSTSGQACSTLWHALRPEGLGTLERLEELLRFEAAVRRFDTECSRHDQPLESMVSLRMMITRALNLANTDGRDLEDLSEKFENIMPNSVGDEDVGRPIPHFHGVYNALCEHLSALMLDDAIILPQGDLATWAMLGSCPSNLAIDRHYASTRDLARQFSLLAAGVGRLHVRDTSTEDSADVSVKLLRRLETVQQVSLGSFSLLQTELRVLSKAICTHANVVLQNGPRSLNMFLERLLSVMLRALASTSGHPRLQHLGVRMLGLLENGPNSPAWRDTTEGQEQTSNGPGSEVKPGLGLMLDKLVHYVRSWNHYRGGDARQCARAYAMIACVGLHLYLPPRALDPALDGHVEIALYDRHHQYLVSQLQSLNLFRMATAGSDSSYRSRVLEKDLQRLGPRPSPPQVYRPEKSEIPQMRADFDALVRISDALWKSVATDSSIQLVRLDDAVMDNVGKVRARLTERYRAYDDFKFPIIGFIDCLLTAHSLVKRACLEKEQLYNFPKFSTLMPLAGASSNSWLDDRCFLHADAACSSQAEIIFWLRLLALRSPIRPLKNCSEALRSAVLKRYHDFYSQWRNDLEKSHRDTVAKSSLYKYKGADDDLDPTEEEVEQYFPVGEAQQQNESADLDRDDVAHSIAQLHQSLFQEQLLDPSITVADCLRQMSKLESSQTIWRHSRDLIPTMIYSLSDAVYRVSQGKKDKAYDMYKDSNVKEASRLCGLLGGVSRRFKELNQAWPDHATPLDVLRLCNDIQQISHSVPLLRFLPNVEKLHAAVYEWQRIASREYSAHEQYEALTSLIISWRQLELSSWSGLFSREKQQCEKAASSWWYVAYEAIITGFIDSTSSQQELRQMLEDLLKTLCDFMTSCGLGEFSHRLQMLRSFQAQTKSMSSEMPAFVLVSAALSNIISYYTSFENTVTKALSKKEEALEKDIQNIVQVASWKDRNIDVLRQSAQSSHKKLLRLVRKYRRLLAEPVAAIIENEFPAYDHTARVSTQSNGSAPHTTEKVKRRPWADVRHRFRALHDNAQTTENIVKESLRTFNAVEKLSAFLEDVSGSIRELQAATPKTSTEDNKTLINHLKTRKRRLLADVLKELRRMGLQTALSQQALIEQASIPGVFSRLPACLDETTTKSAASAQHEFHRLLSIMEAVRTSAKKHSEDLTAAEVARCLNLLESLLQMAVSQQSALSSQMQDMQLVQSAMDQLAALADCAAPAILPNGHDYERKQLDRASALALVLPSYVDVLNRQQDFSGGDYSDLIRVLQEKASQLASIREDGQSMLKLPPNICDAERVTTSVSLRAALLEINAAVHQNMALYPEIQAVISQLQGWTNMEKFNTAPSATNGLDGVDLADAWIGTALTAGADMLESTQASAAVDNVSDKRLEHAWLTGQQKMLNESFQRLQCAAAKVQIDSLMSQLSTIQIEHEWAIKEISDACHGVRSVHEVYSDAVKRHVELSSGLLAQISRTGHMLARSFIQLSTQGFCQPSEQSDKTGKAEGDPEAGTGLGEGEGGEDISKDIADDEDLSEMAQTGNKEQGDGEMEDEKDAVDMADEEMEGELGDRAENDEDQNDAGESGDEMALDEEASKIDKEDSPDEQKTRDGAPEGDQDIESAEKNKAGKEQKDIAAGRESKNGEVDEEEGSEGDVENQETPTAEDIDQPSAEHMDSEAQVEQALELPEDINFGDNKSTTSEESGSEIAASEAGDFKDDESAAGDNEGETEQAQSTEAEDEALKAGQDGVQDPDAEQPPANEEDSNLLMVDQQDTQADGNEEGGESANAGLGADEDKGEPSNQQQNQESSAGDDNALPKDGQSGNANQGKDESKDATDEQQESAEQESRFPFKQLGDALKEWYNQRRTIQTGSDRKDDTSQQQDVNMADARFEHVQDDEAEDTQALGAASAAQSAPLNEDMALQKNEDENTFDLPERPFVEDDPVEDDQAIDQSEEKSGRSEGNLQQTDEATQQVQKGDIQGEDVDMEDDEDVSRSDDTDVSEAEDTKTPDASDDIPEIVEREDPYKEWAQYEENTRNLAFTLTERLRLILQPTQATRLRGDFRTGKRLNIKRIIPYIASSYKRDKIWMRRSVPSKRSYQIMLAIDDSKSMAEGQNRQLAFETLALVTKSMSMLEVGELSVVGFGNEFKLVQDFSQYFTVEAAAETLRQFTFAQDKTDVLLLMRRSLELFRKARLKATGSSRDLWQLQLIISDGICEDHPSIRQLARQAHEERVMIVFIVVDAAPSTTARDDKNSKQSVLDLKTAEFIKDATGEMQLKMVRYLDTFPFSYYLIVRDVQELPVVLAGALQQWFAEVMSIGS